MSLVAFPYLHMRSTWSSHFFDQYMAHLIRVPTKNMVGHVRTSHIFQSLLPANMDILFFDLPCLYTDHITWSINSIFFVLVHPSICACVILLQMSNVRASCRYMQLACRSWILIYPLNLFPSIKQYLLIGNGYRFGFKN